MKNRFSVSIIIILVVSNIVIIYNHFHVLKKCKETINNSSEYLFVQNNKISFLQRNLQLSYSMVGIKINKNLMLNNANQQFQINKLMIDKTQKLVILFPADICSVCFENFFIKLASLHGLIAKENIIILTPFEFFHDFQIYNKRYKMNFENVYAVERNSIANINKIVTEYPVIFIIDESCNISSFFAIAKNNLDIFEQYYKIISSKYFSK